MLKLLLQSLAATWIIIVSVNYFRTGDILGAPVPTSLPLGTAGLQVTLGAHQSAVARTAPYKTFSAATAQLAAPSAAEYDRLMLELAEQLTEAGPKKP